MWLRLSGRAAAELRRYSHNDPEPELLKEKGTRGERPFWLE